MSLWSTLAKVGLGIAAPFTGGATLAGIPAIDAIGGVASGIAGGRAQGRQQETDNLLRESLAQNGRYRNQLDAAQLNLQAPGQRASQSVKGDILANAQPFQWTGGTKMVGNIPVPQSSGGLSPSLFSDDTRQLGRALSSGALQGQTTNGGQAIAPPPNLPQMPQGNAADSILSLVGQIAPFLSLIGQYQKPQQGQPAQTGYVSSNVSPVRF